MYTIHYQEYILLTLHIQIEKWMLVLEKRRLKEVIITTSGIQLGYSHLRDQQRLTVHVSVYMMRTGSRKSVCYWLPMHARLLITCSSCIATVRSIESGADPGISAGQKKGGGGNMPLVPCTDSAMH